MGSRQEAGDESVRLAGLSRRTLIAGTSVAALARRDAATASGVRSSIAFDEAPKRPDRCASWLAIDARIKRLQLRWARLESWLVKEHGWLQLSPSEQQALPWAQELCDIDGCLDLLFEQRETLFGSIADSGTATLESVIARLAVVERLIRTDERPEAHALIAGARRDLTIILGERPLASDS